MKKINNSNNFAVAGSVAGRNFTAIWDKKMAGNYRLIIASGRHCIGIGKKNMVIRNAWHSLVRNVLDIRNDIDCDGSSLRIVDRLSNGKIFKLYTSSFGSGHKEIDVLGIRVYTLDVRFI